jgi:RNA polymerase sigma-70 factor (ECF subfamily)
MTNAARHDPAEPSHKDERRPKLRLVPPLPADPTGGSWKSSRGDRSAPDGTAPDTAAPDGTTPDGATPDGATPDGATPDGATPDGATPDGTTPDGTTPDGTTPDGTTPDVAVTPATADSEAIAKLWHRHGDALLRFALKLTRGDRHRAEDIIQETLLRAWRHPEVVGAGDGAIRAWLFTVTRHVAIDMWRARSRADETIEDWQTELPDPAEPIEQVVTAMEVRAAIAQLTPQQRYVVVAMYFHEQSTVEIAQALAIPVGTVKSRAHYGLRRLRELLTPGAAPLTPGGRVPSAAQRERQIPA